MVEPTWTEIIVVTGDFKGKSEKGLPNNVIKNSKNRKNIYIFSEKHNTVFTNSKPFDFKIINLKFFYLTANLTVAYKRCLVRYR